MINDELSFVFVHINKCGGTSVEHAFGYGGVKHHHCDWYKQQLGLDSWDHYYKFTLVRNPYARLVSLYSFRLKRNVRARGREFGEWLRNAADEDRSEHPTDSLEDRTERLMLAPMLEWITPRGGEPLNSISLPVWRRSITTGLRSVAELT